MELWKTEATERSLVDRMTTMGDELDRLRKTNALAGSIGRLPSECLNDLKAEKEVREAKHSAVKQAVRDLQGRADDRLVKEVDDMAERSKAAYLKLYERVGEEIGAHFLTRLDNGGLHPAVGVVKQAEFDKAMSQARAGGKFTSSAAQDEIRRLTEERRRIQTMKQEKDRQFLRAELPAEGSLDAKTSIGDLFKKYNI